MVWHDGYMCTLESSLGSQGVIGRVGYRIEVYDAVSAM